MPITVCDCPDLLVKQGRRYGGGERRRSLRQVRHETEFCFMRTVLRNWKIGKARMQKLRWIGREDRMPEFPRPQTMATHSEACCSTVLC